MSIKRDCVEELYERCNRFGLCSCNGCPLDSEFALRLLDRKEEPCMSHKYQRHKAWLKAEKAEQDKLLLQGFFCKEWVGWLSRMAVNRQKIENRLVK